MDLNWIRKIPTNHWLLYAAVIAAGLSIFEILDFYELPIESSMSLSGSSSFFLNLVSVMLATGYLGLFVLMLLESISLPIPSEVFLPMAGYLIFIGKMSFSIALAVTTLGGLVGSFLIFYLALFLGRPPIYSLAKYFGITQNSLTKSEKWISGNGSFAVLIARFIPGLRSVVSIPAGVLRMNPVRFSIVSAIGSFGWSMFLILVGYSVGRAWKFGSSAFLSGLLDSVVIYSIAGLSISYVLYYFCSKLGERKKAPAAANFSASIMANKDGL